MIKLIASDIDGTLVKEASHQIDPEYYDIIRRLTDRGIAFCACSGRQYSSIENLFQPVADRIFFIAINGTLIRTANEILKVSPVSRPDYLSLLQEIRKIDGTQFIVEDPDTCWTDAGEDSRLFRWMVEGYHYRIRNVADLASVKSDSILKVAVWHPQIEAATRQLCSSPLRDRFSMVISGSVWLDITAKNVDKGTGLSFLQEYLGVRREETLFFGDGLNDIPGFRQAGVSATVADARSEVREAADLVAGPCAENGVLQELKRILERIS